MTTLDRPVESLLRSAVDRMEAAGIEMPVLEAQLIMAIASGATRLDVICGFTDEVSKPVQGRFDELLNRRLRREPLAYIRQSQEFYGLEFKVSKDVLIPRPETELLVDAVLDRIDENSSELIADVGTGSGCIAISVAVRKRNALFVALDTSVAALLAARENAVCHKVDARIQFAHANLSDAIAPNSAAMIVSNPPYIPTEEIDWLEPEIRCFEPREALDGGLDGLRVYRELIVSSRKTLKVGGWLAVEVGCGQAPDVSELMVNSYFAIEEVRRDLSGIERVVVGRRMR